MANDIGSWVYKWLHKAQKRQRELAEELFISQPALAYKLKHNNFSYADMLTIFDFLDVPDNEVMKVMRL